MRLSFDRSVPVCEQWRIFALNKSVRKAPKKHATGSRRALARMRRRAGRRRAVSRERRVQAHKRLVAAYWRGELIEHPELEI